MLYTDYYWKNGYPTGIQSSDFPPRYKIVFDPYFKHITIEDYESGQLAPKIIYDSKFLDFRYLNQAEHLGWEKITIKESTGCVHCLIRDHHDRVIFLEENDFNEGLCIECRVYSPHGLLLSVNKIHYTLFGDEFNGIILYDAHEHPVLRKVYTFDENTRLFTDLVEECRVITVT